MSCLGAMSVFFGKKGFFDKGNPLSHSLDIMDRSVMAIRGATRNMKYVSTLETARELLQPTPKLYESHEFCLSSAMLLN